MKLVITPLKSEMQGLVDGLKAIGIEGEKKQDQGKWYWEFKDPSFILAVGGHGKVQYGIGCQFWIEKFKATHLICVGAGGGLNPEINPLDVVVGTQVIEHDYKEKFDTNAKAPSFECQTPKIEASQFKFGLFQGSIASGDEDIIDPQRASELHSQTEAQAVAWEGAGGARAAKFNSLPYSEIRAITDNARSDVASDFYKNLPLAMKNAALALKVFL